MDTDVNFKDIINKVKGDKGLLLNKKYCFHLSPTDQ
jgi:hypothetical protein